MHFLFSRLKQKETFLKSTNCRPGILGFSLAKVIAFILNILIMHIIFFTQWNDGYTQEETSPGCTFQPETPITHHLTPILASTENRPGPNIKIAPYTARYNKGSSLSVISFSQ